MLCRAVLCRAMLPEPIQVLREFEVDIDFGGNAIALHPPGQVELGLCDTRGLVEVPLRLTKSEWV
jgi:hypothetical protein